MGNRRGAVDAARMGHELLPRATATFASTGGCDFSWRPRAVRASSTSRSRVLPRSRIRSNRSAFRMWRSQRCTRMAGRCRSRTASGAANPSTHTRCCSIRRARRHASCWMSTSVPWRVACASAVSTRPTTTVRRCRAACGGNCIETGIADARCRATEAPRHRLGRVRLRDRAGRAAGRGVGAVRGWVATRRFSPGAPRATASSRPSMRSRSPRMFRPRIRDTVSRFSRCRECGRIYWRGSHEARLRARLGRVGVHLP